MRTTAASECAGITRITDLVAPSGSAAAPTACPRRSAKEKPSDLEGFSESG